MSELPAAGAKEPIHVELERVQRKCAALKCEVKALRRATDAKENVALRREATAYRKALSNISYRLDNGGVGDADLRSIVRHALFLRGLKVHQRREIDSAYVYKR